VAKKLNNSSKKANALPQRPKLLAKNAQVSFAGLIAAATLLAAIGPFAPPLTARAFPIQTPHHKLTPTPSASPTPTPPPNLLPLGSPLAFVLDGAISSSHSKAGDLVPAHLLKPLIVGGVTVAPAGTKADIKIVDASPASNPDIYGYVDIYARPLTLPDGRLIPLRAPASHLNVDISAGHSSTADIENTIGDVYAPTLLFHIFRKGRNFVLEPGATISLRTQATLITLSNGTVAIETPAPLVLDDETPGSEYRAMPMITVDPSYKPPLPSPDVRITPGPTPTI
jgi:hypothetical protein